MTVRGTYPMAIRRTWYKSEDTIAPSSSRHPKGNTRPTARPSPSPRTINGEAREKPPSTVPKIPPPLSSRELLLDDARFSPSLAAPHLNYRKDRRGGCGERRSI